MSTRIVRDEPGFLSKVLSLTVGMGVGLMAGIVAGELIGGWDSDVVKSTLRKFNRDRDGEGQPPPEPRVLEQAVLEALRHNPDTRRGGFNAIASDTGVVELTGVAEDEATRHLAGEVARDVDDVPLVINRILVRGTDIPAAVADDRPGSTDGSTS